MSGGAAERRDICGERETCTRLHTGDLINGAGDEADHHYGCECPACVAVYGSLS